MFGFDAALALSCNVHVSLLFAGAVLLGCVGDVLLMFGFGAALALSCTVSLLFLGAVFLGCVGGIFLMFGFGAALALSKKKDPTYFAKVL